MSPFASGYQFSTRVPPPPLKGSDLGVRSPDWILVECGTTCIHGSEPTPLHVMGALGSLHATNMTNMYLVPSHGHLPVVKGYYHY